MFQLFFSSYTSVRWYFAVCITILKKSPLFILGGSHCCLLAIAALFSFCLLYFLWLIRAGVEILRWVENCLLYVSISLAFIHSVIQSEFLFTRLFCNSGLAFPFTTLPQPYQRAVSFSLPRKLNPWNLAVLPLFCSTLESLPLPCSTKL